MRSAGASILAGAVLAACALLPTREARADLGPEAEGVGIGFAVAFGLADIGFLSYDIHAMATDVEPEEEVHVARSILFAPQGALSSMVLVFSQHETHGLEWTWGALGPAIFTNAMATYGMWSAASPRLPMEQRFGLSFLIGADLALTAGAISSAFREDHTATPYLAIPELAYGLASAVPCFIQTARDGEHRVEWASLAVWSSAIAIHGATSVGLWASGASSPNTASGRSSTASDGPSWSLAPTPLSDGRHSVPGLMASGSF
ncbi:MAG: hypothetical protein U0414_38160 [Polyangiaceae bacterium]